MAVVLSASSQNLACDAIVDKLDSGRLVLLSGGDYSTGVDLAYLDLSATAFGPAVAGVATASTISDELSALQDGTVDSFIIQDSSSADYQISGTCGETAEDIVLNTNSIQQGDRITITSLTITVPTGP